jgi:hypothetical protein
MRFVRTCAVIVAVLVAACSNPGQRRQAGIQPTYDGSTGKLTELAYDSNKNGRADMWTDMDGPHPIRTRIDANEDGKIEKWEDYDRQGKLMKVAFSRKDNGKPDAWAFSGADGQVERIEISSTGNEKRIDRWEHYDATGLVSAEEDTNGDGAIDRWEAYRAGALATVSFDETGDGKIDRRLTYEDGALVTIDTKPDAAGHFTARTDVK